MSRRPHRSIGQRLVLSLNVLGIVAALGLAWSLQFARIQAEGIARVELTGTLTDVQTAPNGDRVLNILLVGSDSSAGLDPNDPVGLGRVGEQNSDVMIIAHLDERDGSAALLSLPRDLWVPISGTNKEAKLNSAFATGGPERLIKTIEDNYGIPINSYINVDFAGFEDVVAAVGSVPVFFPAPARDWDPAFNRSNTGFEELGIGCVSLGPKEALAYVRSRHYQTLNADLEWKTDPLGDLGRIRRQQDFLRRLLKEGIDLGARNPFVLKNLIDATIGSVTVDQNITPQFLLDLGRAFAEFQPDELQTYSVPTRFGTVGSYSVLFSLDDQAAPILALFSGASPDDPATVLVRVETARDRAEEAAGVVAGLQSAGFSAGDATVAKVDPGLRLLFGPDGAPAAKLVVTEMQKNGELARAGLSIGDFELVQDADLSGREVVLSMGDLPADDGATGSSTTSTTGSGGPSTTVDANGLTDADLAVLAGIDTSCQ